MSTFVENKVALYCRVSTTGQTVDNQKIRLLQYAADKGLAFDMFEEVESTRRTRPVKQELLARLRSRVYSAVVVFKLDRWARSSRELILDTQELVDKGIGFISLSDSLDFSTAAGKLQFQILSAFAEFERALISERTKEGLRRTKLGGKVLGRPPGAKDSRKRRISGYILRNAQNRKVIDEVNGVILPIEHYLNQSVS